MQLKDRIAGLHYTRGETLSPWLWPLLPLEFFYRLAVSLRLWAYRQDWLQPAEPEVPVISIGNLTTGGTGKTPIVIEMARGLIRAGKTVVILSRGYGAPIPIAYGRAVDPRHGDEAFLIQQEVPEAAVIVGRDRVASMRRAAQEYRPDYILLDDGFQYLRLRRSINILLIDGERLFGNKHLLPAGPLREPIGSLRRADLIFVTKTVDAEIMQTVDGWVKRYAKPNVPVIPVAFDTQGFRDLNEQPVNTEVLQTQPVVAISGVARPERFEQDLSGLGLNPLKHFRFTDHHVYTAADLENILAFAGQQDGSRPPMLITTEKDLVKLRQLVPDGWRDRIYSLQTGPTLDGQWFYHEFLTQMPGYARTGDGHVHSSGPLR